jgi:hypothetical protein
MDKGRWGWRTKQRCLTTVNGHPTWKLYCGDVPNSIVIGKKEPPHFVYLDDRACHDVLASHAYSASNLKKL